MIFNHRRLSWLIIFFVMFQFVAFAQVEPSDKKPSISPSDDTAIQAIVTQYFNAFPKKDIAVITSLWGAKSPDFSGRKQRLEKLFAENENIVVKNITFSTTVIKDGEAMVRAVVEVSAIETKTGKPSQEFGSNNRFLNLVKEDGNWKVVREMWAEKELALRLVATKNEAERNQILKDEKELKNVYLANALGEEGRTRLGKVSSVEVLSIFHLALIIAEQSGDKIEMLRGLSGIGNALNYSLEALEAYQKGLKIAEEIGDKKWTAYLLNSIGICYWRQGDYEKAMDSYQRSFIIAEKIGNKSSMAAALGNIGIIYKEQGNNLKSIEYSQKSLALQEQTGDTFATTSTLANLGIGYAIQGDSAQALESFEKSLKICESFGDKEGMGYNFWNIGNIYRRKGNYAKAMLFYQKNLILGEEISQPYIITGALLNIGEVYNSQGNYEQAINYLNKATVKSEQLGDKLNLSIGLGNLGVSYQEQEQYLKAIEYYQKALALQEQIGNKLEVVQSLTNIGTCYFSLGDIAQASEYFQKALKLNESSGNNERMFYTLLAIAEMQLSQGNYAKALETTEQAKSFYEKITGLDREWNLYKTSGRAFRGLGQMAQARENFEKAIAIIENLRTQIAGREEEQQRFFTNKISAYDLMIDLLVSQGKLNEAIDYAERAKSRSLVDALQNDKVDFTKSMSVQEKEEEQRSKSELISLNAQISKENERKQPSKTRIADLQKQLDNKRLASEDFQTRLYSSHPELKVQRGEMNPITVEETGALLPDAKSAMLEFVVAEDRTFLFVITKDAAKKVSLKAFTVKVKDKELGKRVEAYRSNLAGGDLDFQKQSRELYDLLLKPAQAQLAGKTNLIIVPDGPLWDLPFQALQNEKNKYLVEQAAVSYAPSLTALKEMSKKARARRPDAGLELVAFGNPIVAKATSDRVKQVFMSEKLEPLPESERLVNELGKMYGANHSKIFVGEQAREETAKTESPKYRVVQFATHGILNNASPMYSHLVLAQNDKNPSEDGLLEAWEMKDLDLKADMVILSACETARGRISNGEGVIGMSWAMFIAGTPTTVASQWKVESKSTTELMLEFHRQLLAGRKVSKAEALRRASLKIMKMSGFKHPSYWAGFVIVGDGS